MQTDFELLEAWRSGDERAGRSLFERQFDPLYRFFRSKINTGADDLVQETMLACLKSVEKFESRSSFRTYLFVIAKRVLYRHYSAKTKHGVVDFGVTSVRDLGPTPSSAWAEKHAQQLVLEALTQLPLQYQTILELYYWEGLSTPELAEVVEIPVATARTQLRRGRQRLSEVIIELAGDAAGLDDLMRSFREQR